MDDFGGDDELSLGDVDGVEVPSTISFIDTMVSDAFDGSAKFMPSPSSLLSYDNCESKNDVSVGFTASLSFVGFAVGGKVEGRIADSINSGVLHCLLTKRPWTQRPSGLLNLYPPRHVSVGPTYPYSSHR